MNRTPDHFLGFLKNHFLHPRVWQVYRQSKLMGSDLKNNPNAWNVREKWIPTEELVSFLGFGFTPEVHQTKTRGAILFAIAIILTIASFVDVYHGTTQFLASRYLVKMTWHREEMIFFSYVFWCANLGLLVSLGRSVGIFLLIATVTLFLCWWPCVIVVEMATGIHIDGFPWFTAICSAIAWIIINSTYFESFLLLAGKSRIMRIVKKRGLAAYDERRSEIIGRRHARTKVRHIKTNKK